MEVEIRIDRIRCIGSGQCVHLAPGAFDQDDTAIAVVVDPRGEPEDKIVHAVTACPMQAISLHVDGARVTADDLRDWHHGARSDDPIVSTLARLGDDHHELRRALGGAVAEDDPERAVQIGSLTRAHLRDEEQAYSTLTALVDPRLVDAFDDDHGRIDLALDSWAAQAADPARHRRAEHELARALDDHIRLEETVLFPLALAGLARRQSQAVVAPGSPDRPLVVRGEAAG